MNPVVKKAAVQILTLVGSEALKITKRFWEKDHGSKVKRGAYSECPIELFGDKACIIVDEGIGEIIMLTSDTIQSCHYVKEKKRLVGVKYHTYFYYDITFKNGEESYVRMRRKYRDAMEEYINA